MSAPREAVAEAVTALFVPGDRPDRYAKAAASGADLVIIDLEDAVAPAAKRDALRAAVSALAPRDPGAGSAAVKALVRVNPVGSLTHHEEIEALIELAVRPGHGLLGIMLPKAEDPLSVGDLGMQMMDHGLALIPLVESALGLGEAAGIARSAGVTRLAFGAEDFSVDLDLEPGLEGGMRALDYARATLVVAARAVGLPAPLDSPSTEIRDTGRVSAAARHARGFGYGGKLCIHPGQVALVEEAFLPDDSAVAWARAVAAAAEGVAAVDGSMVDRPVVERARRILERSRLRRGSRIG